MNGRVYDPVLGRFLSADPFVDGVSDAQGYNRYSYVGNNPLGATDPTGFFSFKDALKIVAIVVVAYFTAGLAVYAVGATSGATLGSSLLALTSSGGFSLTFAGAVSAGAGAGFGSAFVGSLLNGGSLGDAFKSGVIGAVVGGVSAGIAHGIGSLAQKGAWNGFQRGLAHGVAQGSVTEATGGEFRHGFYAGFATGASEQTIGKWAQDSHTRGVVAAVIVGGTASSLGGGKFANGAASGAFTYLFNWASHLNNVHHTANVKALGGSLSREEIEILRLATVEADADQAVENQYRHAMRDLDKPQTVDQARVLANAYVREHFNNAMDLLTTGDRAGALREFGFALHTIEDSTSPSHQGFQGWRQKWTDHPYTTPEVRAHVRAELTYPGNNSALFRATEGAYKWFESGKVPEGDLFGIYGHD